MKYKFFPKNKKELQSIIKNQIQKFGSTVDLNMIDTSKITDMNNLFASTSFNGYINK